MKSLFIGMIIRTALRVVRRNLDHLVKSDEQERIERAEIQRWLNDMDRRVKEGRMRFPRDENP